MRSGPKVARRSCFWASRSYLVVSFSSKLRLCATYCAEASGQRTTAQVAQLAGVSPSNSYLATEAASLRKLVYCAGPVCVPREFLVTYVSFSFSYSSFLSSNSRPVTEDAEQWRPGAEAENSVVDSGRFEI